MAASFGISGVLAGAMVRPPPGVTVNFLDNFCTVFVSFVSRLNRKIRVPALIIVAVRVAVC